MTPRVEIRLLGGFELFIDAKPAPAFHSARLQCLLAYLALHRSTPHPCQRLAFLLWPDTSEAQARTNLRKLVLFLRQAWPNLDDYISTAGPILQWKPESPVKLDVAEFEAACAGGFMEQALAQYCGDLLPERYEEWILIERERLRMLYHQALTTWFIKKKASKIIPPRWPTPNGCSTAIHCTKKSTGILCACMP